MELVSYDLPWKPITIIPLGDIQWAGCDGPTTETILQAVLAKAKAENAYFVGMGDYIDFLSPSNRQRLGDAHLYDTAMDVIDKTAVGLTQELFDKYLRPTKGRWLGLAEGHHFAQLKTGITTDQKLCEWLDAPFLGSTAFIRLNFLGHLRKEGNRSGGFPFTLWVTHGNGGTGKIGAPLTKLENIATYWDADMFLMGHHTKEVVGAINRISAKWHPQGHKLVHRKIMLVGTGGFSKSYVEKSKEGNIPRGNYVEQGLMNPAALGAPIIRIRPFRDGNVWSPEVTVEI